jgi:hypothetical protein
MKKKTREPRWNDACATVHGTEMAVKRAESKVKSKTYGNDTTRRALRWNAAARLVNRDSFHL